MPDGSFISARPAFKVDGETNSDMQQAVTGMVVNLPLNGMAHAELMLTNWGATGDGGRVSFLFQQLALGKTVEILMGGAEGTLLFKGEITALEERYGGGAPQLVVLLQDKLHRLARRRQSRAYEDMSVDAIVQAIAGDAGLRADVSASTDTATFHQLNESDLAFLTRLLSRLDIALRLQDDSLRARAEEADAEPVELNAQDSVLQVRLIADLAHQYGKTAVLGYNLGTDEAVDDEVSALPSPPEGTTAYDTLDQLGWPGDELVPSPFPRSRAEAGALAQAHFRRAAKRFINGDIRCQGEAGLRSGREIRLSGVSERMSGTYQVVHCVHRFDGNTGFETHLKVQRAGWRV